MSHRLFNRTDEPSAVISGPVIHVRAAGRSLDLPMSQLDLGSASTDGAVRQLVADYLDISAKQLVDHTVDRHANGNLTLRPPAVFG
jgi:hypothetical protein